MVCVLAIYVPPPGHISFNLNTIRVMAYNAFNVHIKPVREYVHSARAVEICAQKSILSSCGFGLNNKST